MPDHCDLARASVQPAELSSRKDHRFLVDLYAQIEQRFDVNNLTLEGVNIWPLLRLQLGRSFKEADPITDAGTGLKSFSSNSSNPSVQQAPLPRNKSERSALLKRHAKAAKADSASSRLRVEADFARLEELAGPKFVVQTKIEKYYLEKSDGFYAPILDPVAEDLERFGRVQRLALEPLPIDCIHDPLRVDLNAYLAVRSWDPVDIPEELDRVLQEIEVFTEEVWPEYPLKRKLVYSRFNRLRQRRDFYYEVYKRLKPEFVVVSSFTGWLHAVWAAKDLDIPVIDVQHGGQGPIHITTTHFTQHPIAGYHFLPDVLWLWGKFNHDFAAKWHPGVVQNRHLPVVGGHRGVAQWDKERKAGKLSVNDQAFIERYGGGANVLVTLSYAIDPLMPQPFFQAIQATPELHWLIRLHPIHRSDAARDQIIGQLTVMGCENYSIDEPTDVQMQTALCVSLAHLTPFSTSVREAVAFGVPSAICHQAGRLLFVEEIETGLLEYAEDMLDIINFVKRNLAKNSVTKGMRRDSIEIEDEALEDVVAAASAVRDKAIPLHSDLPSPTALLPIEKEDDGHKRSGKEGGFACFLNAIKQKLIG